MRYEKIGSGRLGLLKWTKEVPSKRFCDGEDTVSLLLVDKASHAQFVKSLYGDGAVFVFFSPPACKIWLCNLKDEHRDMLQDIRCCKRYVPMLDSFYLAGDCAYAPELYQKVRFGCGKMVYDYCTR